MESLKKKKRSGVWARIDGETDEDIFVRRSSSWRVAVVDGRENRWTTREKNERERERIGKKEGDRERNCEDLHTGRPAQFIIFIAGDR